MILFSIITINYNNLNGLKKTFLSVIRQVYDNYEFIIVDGGSTDGSKEFIQSNSSNLTHWISEKDNGVYHAMNKGLKLAQGKFCLFLNSGDFFCDKNVLFSVEKLIDREADLIYGLIQWEKTNELWNPKRELKSFEMAFQTLIPHQGAFFNTYLIKQIGGYKEEFKVVSDWGLMLKLIEKKYKIQKIDIVISICEQQGISSHLEYLIRNERLKYLIKYSFFTLIKSYLFSLKKYIRKK